eukprot:Amastigsp_a1207_476.p2 type:complete len:250 gc:universal Amastigsp_a1207_476:431-1180(+)
MWATGTSGSPPSAAGARRATQRAPRLRLGARVATAMTADATARPKSSPAGFGTSAARTASPSARSPTRRTPRFRSGGCSCSTRTTCKGTRRAISRILSCRSCSARTTPAGPPSASRSRGRTATTRTFQSSPGRALRRRTATLGALHAVARPFAGGALRRRSVQTRSATRPSPTARRQRATRRAPSRTTAARRGAALSATSSRFADGALRQGNASPSSPSRTGSRLASSFFPTQRTAQCPHRPRLSRQTL